MATPNQPFDIVAQDYDATFTYTETGRLQRARVRHFLSEYLAETAVIKVLEVNCGTGEDACWLAREGKKVDASDISAGMIERAEQKRQQLPLSIQANLQFTAQSITNLSPPEQGQAYDLVFSNFGGLNCLSPQELHDFLARCQSLVRPGGYLVLVVMGRFCWWESLYFLLKGKVGTAFRRIRRKPTAAQLDADTTIATWYYSAQDISKSLDNFRLSTLQPIGFWLPPSYLDNFFRKRPRLLQTLDWLEKKTSFGHWAADHYFLALQRQDESGK